MNPLTSLKNALSSLKDIWQDKPVSKSDSIVDSRLFIGLDLDITTKANSLFQTEPYNRAHLANQILLYNKIIIPTKDYGIIPILINWLGLKSFRKALDSNAFSFLHRKTLLGYAGNGGGINGYIISETETRRFVWWQHALFGEKDLAIEEQLRNMCPFIEKSERAKILQIVLSCSKDVSYDNEFFMKNIVHETYTDILSNNFLRNTVTNNSKHKSSPANLARLKGVEPNQIRIFNINRTKDPIDLVLRIAEINMEIYMSTLADGADLFTSQGANELLKDKLIRTGIGSNHVEGFSSLLELTRIPNIKEIVKLYIDAIDKKSLTDSLPMKACKFITISYIGGTIEPNTGLAAAIIENFFVEKWLKGYSPKLFIDELSKIQTRT